METIKPKFQKICNKCGLADHGSQPCVTNIQEFCWKHGGTTVFLSGSWSLWQVKIPMKQLNENSKVFYTTVNLIPGNYHYKYEVDGRWCYDPENPYEPNRLGIIDNVIEVVPAMIEYSSLSDNVVEATHTKPKNFSTDKENAVFVKIATRLEGNLKLKGSWDNWQSEIKMVWTFYQALNCYENVAFLLLDPGNYDYKFKVEGKGYIHDLNKFNKTDNYGGYNNFIKVLARPENFGEENKELFNVSNLKWTKIEVEELNFSAIQGHSINLFGDEFFIFGGFHHGKFLDTLRCISTTTLQVEQPYTTGKAPEARAYHNTVVHVDRLIIYGGLNEWNVFNDYYILNTLNMNWVKIQTFGDVPSPREKCSLNNVMDEFLVLFGGYSCSYDFEAEYDYNDLFSLNLSTMVWKKLEIKSKMVPDSRYGHSTIIYKKKLYLFGGIHRTGEICKCFNDIFVVDFCKNENLEWEKLECKGNGPKARYSHSATLVKHYMIVYAGRDVEGNLLDDVSIFDLKENKWLELNVEGVSPGARWLHASLNADNSEMIVFGGAKALKTGRSNAIYSLNSGSTNLKYSPSLPGTPQIRKKRIGSEN